MNKEYSIYSVNVDVRNMETGNILRKDTIMYHSLDAAKTAAKRIAQCIDVANVEVMDENTGEIMWYQLVNGETYEAAL